MLHTFFKVALLGVLTASLSLADDFLARATNGALSDNSVGVKKLTADEASKVVGGYVLYHYQHDKDHNKKSSALAVIFSATRAEVEKGGLCGIDQTSCANPSQRRLVEWLQVVNGYGEFRPVYIVRRQIQISPKGNRFVVFSYGVGAYHSETKQLFQFNAGTSSTLLNNNMVIKEIAGRYKETVEGILGGWNPNVY